MSSGMPLTDSFKISKSWRLQRVAVGAFNQTHCGHGMTCSSATICKHPSQSFAPSNLSQHRMLHSSPNAGALPQHEVLEMPALSPTMKTGILEVWHIKEGEAISAGDCMATIVTDKSSMSFDAQENGVLAKILVADGTADVPIGQPIAVIVDSAEDVAAFADYTGPESSTGASKSSSTSGSKSSEPDPPAPAANSGRRASSGPWSDRLGPAVRTALALRGLSACDITPSGPRGIITKADVLAAAARPGQKEKQPATSPPKQGASTSTPAKPPTNSQELGASVPGRVPRGVERYTDVPVTQMRRVIAKRLLESKLTIPAIYVSADARLGALSQLRAALKESGVRASVNDCVVRAVAMALRKVPAVCAGWDAKKEEAVRYEDVDVCVAVATNGGLMTPIVKGADRLSILEISAAVRDLAGRARENKLAPHEFQGGSFSVSNLGMYGVRNFSAIINPPQACILAVGGPQSVVSWQGRTAVQESVMTVTLSADSRVVGEESAAEFLQAFVLYIENPALLMYI